jgi:hypothetical protein
VAGPLLSVVVETTSIGEHGDDPAGFLGRCLDSLSLTLDGLDAEVLVMQGNSIGAATLSDQLDRCPGARIVDSSGATYVEMKWRGTQEAHGDLVAYIDGDCVATSGWAAAIVEALGDADVSTGRTLYASTTWRGRAAQVFDFGFSGRASDHRAFGIIYSNLAMRRTVALAVPADLRFRRSGGCGSLYTRLKQAGASVVYSPDQVAIHHDDWRHGGWVAKRVRNGVDAAKQDRVAGRARAVTPATTAARRLAHDAWRLTRWRDPDLPASSVPPLMLLALVGRTIEAAAGVAASIRPEAFSSYG